MINTFPPHLGVRWACGSVTVSVIHDGTIGAHHTLHCSHLVSWPTGGSALDSVEAKRGSGNINNMQKHRNGLFKVTSKLMCFFK